MNAFAFDTGSADFEQAVLAASHRCLVLVDFWAEWCGPCKVLKPILERLAVEYGGRFLLAKLDSDAHPELAARFGVRGIPNVKAFRDGEVVAEFTGALPEGEVRTFIDRLLPSPAEPLRAAAAEARRQGEAEVALALLDDAAQADPNNREVALDRADLLIDAGQFDAAGRLLAELAHHTELAERRRALEARLALAARGGAEADLASLQARTAADPTDLDARLRLADALALRGDYRAALEHLLAIVKQDKQWHEEAGRKTMLDLFALLSGQPAHDNLVREFRVQLARTLN